MMIVKEERSPSNLSAKAKEPCSPGRSPEIRGVIGALFEGRIFEAENVTRQGCNTSTSHLFEFFNTRSPAMHS